MFLICLSAIVAALVATLLLQRKNKQQYWTRRGVPQVVTTPFSILVNYLKKISFVQLQDSVYNKYPGARYTGLYFKGDPIIMIKDLELIKHVGVKDFDHFVDHRQLLPDNLDRLWTRNLFVLQGEEWRDMRLILTPTFTADKMKIMHALIHDAVKQFIKNYRQIDKELIHVNFKDAFGRFTNDIIASAAFGVQVNSIAERDNVFYAMGKRAMHFKGLGFVLKLLLFQLAPKLAQIFDVTLIPREITNYFTKLVSDTIEERQSKGIVRPDMLYNLLEARKNLHKNDCFVDYGFGTIEESQAFKAHIKQKYQQLTDLDITAQAFVFFVRGFDTLSSLISFMSQELAINQTIQNKLRDEIKQFGGDITHDQLQKMQYLDMVVLETLRKWPCPVTLSRICTKTYTIEAETVDEQTLTVEKGCSLWIPVMAIHRDPKHYPNPGKFEPQRFSEENKHQIDPYAYLPFGVGPRACIGNRFALLVAKLLFFELLHHFQIVPTEKSQIPPQLNEQGFIIHAEDGFQLGLKKLT